MTVPNIQVNQPILMVNASEVDHALNRFCGPELMMLAATGKISGKVPVGLKDGVISGQSAMLLVRGWSPQLYLTGGSCKLDYTPLSGSGPSATYPLWSDAMMKALGYTQGDPHVSNAGEAGKAGEFVEDGFLYLKGTDKDNKITITNYSQNFGTAYGNAPNILGQAYQKNAAGLYIYPNTKLQLEWVDVIGGDDGVRGDFQWVLCKNTKFIHANNGNPNNHGRYINTHAFVDCDSETSGTRTGHDFKHLAAWEKDKGEWAYGVTILYRPLLPPNVTGGESYRFDMNSADNFIVSMNATDVPGDSNAGTMLRLNVLRQMGGPISFNIIGSRLDAALPKVLGSFFRLDDQAMWWDTRDGVDPSDPKWFYQAAKQIKNADGSLVYANVTVLDDGNVFLWDESAGLKYSYGSSLEPSGNLLLPSRPNIKRIRGKNIAMRRDAADAATAQTRLDFSLIIQEYGELGQMVADGNDPDFWNEQSMDRLVAVEKARAAGYVFPVGIGQSPAPAGPLSLYVTAPVPAPVPAPAPAPEPAPAPAPAPEPVPVPVETPPAETPPAPQDQPAPSGSDQSPAPQDAGSGEPASPPAPAEPPSPATEPAPAETPPASNPPASDGSADTQSGGSDSQPAADPSAGQDTQTGAADIPPAPEPPAPPAVDPKDAKIAELTDEVTELQSELSEVKGDVKEYLSDLDKLKRDTAD